MTRPTADDVRTAEERARGVFEQDAPEPEGWAAAVLLSEVERLRARVTELEAEREPTGIEWGVRAPDGIVKAPARYSEQMAHRVAASTGGVVMVRDAYAPGPWRVAT